MLTVPHVLAALVVFACWFVFVLVSPTRRRCTWCKGTRRAKRHRYYGRVSACRKCKARGKHQRFGAAVVHKFVWAVAGDRVKAAISKKGYRDVQK